MNRAWIVSYFVVCKIWLLFALLLAIKKHHGRVGLGVLVLGSVLGSVLGFIYNSLTVADCNVNTLQCQ